ncbi:hypothetical protein [Umezawaea tangerina]|uniref:Uncharacterized protein n=1 Tax=Umezawaea tangerina TaxID=84725 RepID=A0A2T0SNA4_9PSEU|nr:hypothetical protein [Umezawaea tangerina]PRY34892.1 hypothetical protein CLV43_115169 [Umezawaea tangerina]
MPTTPAEPEGEPDTTGPAAPDRELSTDKSTDEPAVLTPATEDPE